MATKTEIKIGALILVILTSTFYIMWPENVRIDFEDTRTVFKVYEDDRFVISGREYVRVFDGSTKMLAKYRGKAFYPYGNETRVYKVAIMQRDKISIRQYYTFINNPDNVEQVPVSEKVCFSNATGKIFEWLIQDITYEGETKEITSPFSFGKKMKVTFQDGYYRAKVYQNKYAADKIIVRYRITEDDQCFDVKLFDPELAKEKPKPISESKTHIFSQGSIAMQEEVSPSWRVIKHDGKEALFFDASITNGTIPTLTPKSKMMTTDKIYQDLEVYTKTISDLSLSNNASMVDKKELNNGLEVKSKLDVISKIYYYPKENETWIRFGNKSTTFALSTFNVSLGYFNNTYYDDGQNGVVLGIPKEEFQTLYLPLNETSGTKGLDYAGNRQNNLTWSNSHIAFVNDNGKQVLRINGSQVCCNDGNVAITSEIDMIETLDASMCLNFKNMNSNSLNSREDRLFRMIGAAQKFVFILKGDGTSNLNVWAKSKNFAYNYTKNIWYHTCFTFDNSANTVKQYVNGNLVDTNAGFSDDYSYVLTTFRVGARDWEPDRNFNGSVSDIRFYTNYSLTADEVEGIYLYDQDRQIVLGTYSPQVVSTNVTLPAGNLTANVTINFTANGQNLNVSAIYGVNINNSNGNYNESKQQQATSNVELSFDIDDSSTNLSFNLYLSGNATDTPVIHSISYTIYNQSAAAPAGDSTPPTFTAPIPQNQSLQENITFVMQINATDETALDTFAVNDTGNFSINSTGYLINATHLSVGMYQLNITVNDTTDNKASTYFWVNITKPAAVNATPAVSVSLVTPSVNGNVTQNEFFEFTVETCCNQGTCGVVNVTLDPEIQANGTEDIYTFNSSVFNEYCGFFKINMSQVDESPTLALLHFYIQFNTSYVSNSNVSKITDYWNESSTAAVLGALSTSSHSTQTSGLGESQWHNFTVTSIVQACYSAGETENCSIRLSGGVSGCDDADTIGSTGNVIRFQDSTLTGTHYLQIADRNNITAWHVNITYPEDSTKSGIISTTAGTTPFYTNASGNPLQTSSLSSGSCENTTFYVNATGTVSTTHEFHAYVNISSNYSISNLTSKINLTIVAAAATSDCTCPASGNLLIDDGCIFNITTTCDLGANRFDVIDGGIRIYSGGALYSAGGYIKYGEVFYVDSAGKFRCP